LLLSLTVVLGTRTVLGEAAFSDWGWRVPFLLSSVLLALSVYIRLGMDESPAFVKIKIEGKTSKAPLSESFARWKNMRVVLVALFGLTAGQAVVWYSGHFYTLFFLTQSLKVDDATANVMVATALVLGTPFFIVFGAWSDKIGRKPIIMTGCLLAVLTYFPAFQALTVAANPDLARAQAENKVLLHAHPAECSFQFSPTETRKFTSACDIAKQALSSASVSYENVLVGPATPVTITVGNTVIRSYSSQGMARQEVQSQREAFTLALASALKEAGYPARADMVKFDKVRVIAILTYLVILVAMVYGPLAAMLVELFPTRIRYTSMSLPYHIGNGWFGGLMPTMAFAIVAHTGSMYDGLWYPVIVAGMTCVVGFFFVKETKDVDIYAKD